MTDGGVLPGLPHRFNDPALLREALSHRSVGRPHNERLEFLGDGLVGAVVAELLFRRFPRASEGELTRLRSRLVRRETLAELARELRLGEHLRLGSGELKSGGFRRESILADAFEALVGALYLDAGWTICRDWLAERYRTRIESLDLRELADAKSRLQEWLQARGRGLPDYRLIASAGDEHALSFEVECLVEGVTEPVRAQASSRKQAEQLAAAQMLANLTG